MKSMKPCIGLAIMAILTVGSSAAFLAKGDAEAHRRSVAHRVEEALGKGTILQERVAELEEALWPMFTALPKIGQNVGLPSARYALRRLFLKLHGWQMKTLSLDGSIADAFGPHLSERLVEVFDNLNQDGLDLQELAVMAATLEHAVRVEADARLLICLRAGGYTEESELQYDAALETMQVYMANWIIGGNLSDLTDTRAVLRFHEMHDEAYPRWSETKRLVQAVLVEKMPSNKRLDFKALGSLLAIISHRFSKLEIADCQVLKHTLIGMEELAGNGRVRLGDFYRPVLDGVRHEFRESKDYLLFQGSLDESNPGVDRVIIPNYIQADSNCVADSGFYAVCCVDECEDLLGELESKLQGPSAVPAQLMSLVAGMPSASLPSNRTLSRELQGLLHDVAAHHDGEVPLHGRLFAQWMHHAYPRECTFPQGKVEKEFPQPEAIRAMEDDMLHHIQKPYNSTEQEGLCSSLWAFEEELVDPEALRLRRTSSISQLWQQLQARTPFGAALTASVAVLLAKTAANVVSGKSGDETWNVAV